MAVNDLKGKKILVVDDEEMLREVIVETIKGEGYTVLDASSGNAAIGIINSQKIDLVLSDVRMPDGDGIHLLNHIRTRSAPRPLVIFFTGFSDLNEESAAQMGASALIQKPFRAQELIEIIRKFLGA